MKMSRQWTKEQQEAISKSGTNMIISAGAGSGKTAVLTERVIEKLRHGTSIRSLLILTFTNAAASEMKERIRSALQKEESLKEELDQLDSAYITTFDSYALSLVKKYHYLLDVPKQIAITSSSIVSMKRVEIIDQILHEYYEKKDPAFVSFIHSFCIKGDQNIRDAIRFYDDKLNLRTDKVEYLSHYLDHFYNEENIDSFIQEYVQLLQEQVGYIQTLLSSLELVSDGDYYYKIRDVLEPLFQAQDYSQFLVAQTLKLKNAPKGSSEELKKMKQQITDVLKDLKSLLVYEDTDEIKRNLYQTKPTASILVDIFLRLDQEMKAWKKRENAYEFHDISRMSLELLKEHPEVCAEIKQGFSEILVDEYQDTNDIQEEFISYIANHNVYMVGDIKQSIYQFRNANPYIFKQKYDQYKQEKDGIKIDLIKNFRSRKEVLADINVLFDPWMDDEIGGANYKQEHQMVAGNKMYDEEGKTDENYHMDLLNYTYEKESPYTRREIEIFTIAQDIKKKIDQKFPIFDMKKGVTRPAEYKDFTILLQTGSDYDLYKKIFLYFGIPLQVYQDESIKSSYDVHLLKNIFLLLDAFDKQRFDTTFTHAFMSVGRSFLMEYTDRELYHIIQNKSYQNTTLAQICLKILPFLSTSSLSQLVEKVIEEFDFYRKIIKVGDITHTLARLDHLSSVAKGAQDLGFDIPEFVAFLEEVLNGKEDIKMKGILDQSNTVKLMNIHKSKGLEFPICYFASLDRKFNTDDVKGDFLYDKKYGLIFPYFEDGLKDTILKTLYKETYTKEMISEKIRLFYVALTRAKEKMIFVTDLSPKEDHGHEMIPTLERLSYRSFGDMLCSIKERLEDYIKPIDLEQLSLSKDYLLELKVDLNKKLEKTNDKIIEHTLSIPTREIKEIHYSKENHQLIEEDLEEVLKLGSEAHLLLEVIDFTNPDLSMIQSDFLRSRIQCFLDQPLLKNIEQGKVYKEYAFVKEDHMGMIDLFIVYEDHIDVIDYKLKNIDDPAYIHQVHGYQDYLHESFGLPVHGYLYSLFDGKLKKV